VPAAAPVPVAVTAWRLLVAASAGTGVALAAREYDVWWTALSQLANLAVAAAFLGLAAHPLLTGRPEPRSPWLRGLLATVMALVALAYLPMQNGNLTETWSLLEHVVTPALVLTDFALVGANQARVRWWHPISWLLPPLLYLAWYVGGGLQVYVALDPADPASFGARLAVLAALALTVGFGLYATGRRRRPLAEPVPHAV